jgi:hypothetical protein
VVDGAAYARSLEEDELERRIGDGEVGVAGLGLGRLHADHPPEEVHGFVDVGDVEGKLEAHG